MKVTPVSSTFQKYGDYIPGVSTVKSLVDIFHKVVTLPRMNPAEIQKSRYYTLLSEKSMVRCVVLLIPVLGNIVIGVYDFFTKNPSIEEKKEVPIKEAVKNEPPAMSPEMVAKEKELQALRDEWHTRIDEIINDTLKLTASPDEANSFFYTGISQLPAPLQEDRRFLQELIRKDRHHSAVAFHFIVEKNQNFKTDAMLMTELARAIPDGYRELFNYADDEVKKNPDFILALLESQYFEVDLIPNVLLDNPPFMIRALDIMKKPERMAFDGVPPKELIKLAGERVRKNPEYAFAVLQIENCALEDVDPSFRRNGEFLIQAARNGAKYEQLRPIDHSLLNDKAFMLKITQLIPDLCRDSGDALKDDLEYMRALIQRDGLNIGAASDRLKMNKELALLAIEKSGHRGNLLWHLILDEGEGLTHDETIVRRAVAKNPHALRHASYKLQELIREEEAYKAALRNFVEKEDDDQ